MKIIYRNACKVGYYLLSLHTHKDNKLPSCGHST
nr:MAG TPA: hypothetical protein [Caudoviricetes sp.]